MLSLIYLHDNTFVSHTKSPEII